MAQSAKLPDLPRPAMVAGFIVVYSLALYLAERSYGSLSVPSPFWLPDSVLLTTLLLVPRSHWWVFAVVIWPVRIAIGVVPGTPMWFQLVALANDTTKGLVAAWLLDRFVARPLRLTTIREFIMFVTIAGAAVPAASALAAAPARYALGDPFWRGASGWFLGDAVAQVVITPMLLFWCRRDFVLRVGIAEAVCAWCGLAAALFVNFLVDHPTLSLPFMYLPIPFLIWIAVRLGPFGAAHALAVVAAVAMMAAVEGRGVFAGESAAGAVLSIQLFLLVVGTSVLALAILVNEHAALRAREAAWSSRLLDTQEHERSRIASELHDDIGQQVSVLLIDIHQLVKSPDIPESGRQQLRTLFETATRLSSDIRATSHNLHPLIIDVIGIEAAVRRLCQQFAERQSLDVRFHCAEVPAQLPRAVSLCTYRLVQEGLHNVVNHSGTTAVSVELVAGDGDLTVSVSDAGLGFDPDRVIGTHGLGLISMRERVRAVGGQLDIDTAPQSGTRLRAVIPIPRPHVDSSRALVEQISDQVSQTALD